MSAWDELAAAHAAAVRTIAGSVGRGVSLEFLLAAAARLARTEGLDRKEFIELTARAWETARRKER